MSKRLIPYITAGFPRREWFEDLVVAIDEAGADVIEIGVPFSDPIADGPTIQAASQRALDNGVTAAWILEEITRFRPRVSADLIFFSYFNPLAALGDGDLNVAAARIREAGFWGVLVPDLALEEAGALTAALQPNDLHYVPLIAPTTTDERLRAIAPHTTAFAYGVSVTGVTGARAGVSIGLDDYLARVRRILDREFVVGFGVSTPEDAANIARIADGVVVGSALIRLLEDKSNRTQACRSVRAFITSLREAIDAVE